MDKEFQDKLRNTLSLNLYYILIGVISLLALIFLPLAGVDLGLEWNIPDTTVGWIVFVVLKALVSIIGLLLFHCFVCQARVNVKDNKDFVEAMLIYSKEDKKHEHKILSPKQYFRKLYGTKGVTLALGSAVGVFALTQAILSYDWMSLITYIFVLLLNGVFGLITMKKVELYWIEDFPLYIKTKYQKEKEECLTSETKNLET